MTDEATAPAGTGTETAADATADKGTADAAARTTLADGGEGAQPGAGKAADGGPAAGDNAAATADKAASGPAWPEDWRTRLAGDDKAKLKSLARYTDPEAFAKKIWALEAKISAGEFKAALPKDATPEQVAAWRKENGLPEKPEDYKIELPNGMVLGEADKPVVGEFTKFAHANNLTPEAVNKTLAWYYQMQDQQAAARAEADDAFQQQARDELIGEWGPQEFRRNLNAMTALRDQMPKGLAERLLGGRTADGRLIGDDPGFLRWMASLGREINPAATLVPAAADGGAKGLDDRLNELKKMMGDRSSDYWRGPTAEGLQKEYRDLVAARDKMKSRAA